MELKLPEGPWQKMFSGNFEKHELEIEMNESGLLIVVMPEKEGETITGYVLSAYKVFACMGEVENFVASLPREAIVLEKHSKEETIKYILLASKPVFVKNNEEEFDRESKHLLMRIKESGKLMQDIAKAYDLQLVEINKADKHVKTGFFSMPLLSPILATAQFTSKAETEELIRGEVIFGLTVEGTRIIEPIHLLARTLVVSGNFRERAHVLHLIAEGALKSDIPVVLFDWRGCFRGLAEAAKNLENLKSFDKSAEPFGFPVKNFMPLNDVTVDLNLTNIKGLLDIFGVKEERIAGLIEEVANKNKFEDIEDMAKKIQETDFQEKYNDFEIAKAVRVVKLIGIRYPRLFGGSNDVAELSKNWLQTIGRAGIINLAGLDNRETLLLCHNLINGVFNYYKTRGRRSNIVSFLILPDAEKILHRDNSNELCNEIVSCLIEMEKYGLGFALAVNNELDLKEEVQNVIEAKINVVEGNDIGVQLKGKKLYRVLLRTGFSECTEQAM